MPLQLSHLFSVHFFAVSLFFSFSSSTTSQAKSLEKHVLIWGIMEKIRLLKAFGNECMFKLWRLDPGNQLWTTTFKLICLWRQDERLNVLTQGTEPHVWRHACEMRPLSLKTKDSVDQSAFCFRVLPGRVPAHVCLLYPQTAPDRLSPLPPPQSWSEPIFYLCYTV